MTKTEPKTYSPAAVANNILWLARKENIEITPMKLIKLVYFVYGWCLALTDRKLFDDRIEAWPYGPVIPSLYNEFKRFGSSPIDTFAMDARINDKTHEIGKPEFTVVDKNDQEVHSIINAVWDPYKNYTAFRLSNITHKEGSPWSIANGKGSHEKLDDKDIVERSLEGITKFYGTDGE
ncbi:MAG: SocA family protein [Alphaproteobacteria bacterium]|nr:SocA family protein [Alphaproteobacteria bacterium]